MSYDEVEIEDMKWDEQLQAYTYSCPCGDLFQITLVSYTCGSCLCECSESAGMVWVHTAMGGHALATTTLALHVNWGATVMLTDLLQLLSYLSCRSN
jgi:diphthamide biosynthesis protein 3